MGYAPFDWEKNVRRVGRLIENFLRQNYFFCTKGARARSRMNPGSDLKQILFILNTQYEIKVQTTQ